VAGCDASTPPAEAEVTLPPASALVEEVQASPESTQALGVTQWKIYEETTSTSYSALVYGVDADGNVRSASRIGGGDPAADATDAADGVIVEAIYPDHGTLRVDAQGQVVASDMPVAAAQVLAAFGADFQAGADQAGTARASWACWRAGVILGAACGAGIAECILTAPETLGLGCAIGGALCVAAYQDWLCECHDRCIND
jgi:hypothetical protein